MKNGKFIKNLVFITLALSAIVFSQFSVFADSTNSGELGEDGAGLETDVYYDYSQTFEWSDEDQQAVIDQIKAVQATKEVPSETGFLSVEFADIPPNMIEDIKITIYRNRNEEHTVYLTKENEYKDNIELPVGTYNSYKAISMDNSYSFMLTPGSFDITKGQTTNVSMDLDTRNINKEIEERIAKSELESKKIEEASESNAVETNQNTTETHSGFNFPLLYLAIIPIGILVFVIYYKFREEN